jgi:sterol desaturase/sphingolipid hydroxylase (fatty acid hydroxylase superfamily)
MDKATFVVCVTTIASVGSAAAGYFQIDLWPNGWSFGIQVAAALLVADAATYLRHRLSHKSDLLWRFHRVHHSMTELYWIRSAYTHPVEQLLILCAIMLPISLLGAGDQVVAVVAFVFGLSGLVQHANVDARSSVLNYVFATPEVHRVHHRADDGSHSNFSAFFVLMDHLFGTYRAVEPWGTSVRVGLPDEPEFPKDFWSHLTIPFRRDAVAAANEAKPAADGPYARGA